MSFGKCVYIVSLKTSISLPFFGQLDIIWIWLVGLIHFLIRKMHTHSPQININTKQTKTLRNDKTISKTTQKLTQKNKTEPKIEFIECFETDSVNVVALVFLLPIE